MTPMFAYLALLSLLSWGSAASAAALSARTAETLDHIAGDVVPARSPGLIVGVALHGETVFLKAYGKASIELDAPMTPQSVVRIGSVTKEFTAAAVMLLVRDGKLALEDPLSKFVPEYPQAGDVTVRQLLTHTSGVTEITRIPNYIGKDWRLDRTPSEMAVYLAANRPSFEFAPGSAWSYSNSGYILLGAVIERASGTPIAQFYQTRLFTPLGLQQTAIDDPRDIVPLRSAGYDLDASDPSKLHNAAFLSMTAPGAGGFLRSTAADLLRWNEALFGGKVVPASLLEQMMTPGRLNDGRRASEHLYEPKPNANAAAQPQKKFDYGFGLEMSQLDGHRRIGHGGAIPGFQTRLDYFPDDKLSVVIMVNSLGGMQNTPDDVQRAVLAQLSHSGR